MSGCEYCGGEVHSLGWRPRNGEQRMLFVCEDCGHEFALVAPDFVVLKPGSIVACRACGDSYQWACPVPISVFVAGNEAYAWQHYRCGEWRDEARARLIAFLKQRVDTTPAMELQPPKEEGSS